MAEGERLFSYVAIDPAGRRIKGVVSGFGDDHVFQRLKREGLSPVSIRAAAGGGFKPALFRPSLSDRDYAAFLGDLAALLGAGANMRASLSVLGARSGDGALRGLVKALSAAVEEGQPLDRAFARTLPKRQAFVAPIIAAGDAAGDLAGGCRRAGDMLTARVKLIDQLVSVLSYPAFVAASTLAAIVVILVFVVPALAPLVQDSGAPPPMALGVMIALSEGLTGNALAIGVGLAALAAALAISWRAGLLKDWFEGAMLDGPAGGTARALVFGGFAISLGHMLSAGAPMADALRLAIRATSVELARKRLEPLVTAVRQGAALPDALDRVKGVPQMISRMAAVGAASGALGPMLLRAGTLEEEGALRRIEGFGRLAGPALIVLLGGIVGSLMAGLLSGVTQLGQAALQ